MKIIKATSDLMNVPGRIEFDKNIITIVDMSETNTVTSTFLSSVLTQRDNVVLLNPSHTVLHTIEIIGAKHLITIAYNVKEAFKKSRMKLEVTNRTLEKTAIICERTIKILSEQGIKIEDIV